MQTSLDSFIILLRIVLLVALVMATLYRMWLNAKAYRILYNYDRPSIFIVTKLDDKEINKATEANVFVLFCFFTFFWIRFTPACKHFQIRSNFIAVGTIILFMILLYLMMI